MIDFSFYQGIGQFDRAYQIMLENDTHAPGSVDRALAALMIRLCPQTAAYLYGEYTSTQVRYQRGSRPELECYVEEAMAECGSDEERVEKIARFCSDLGKSVSDELDEMRFGGTEEEIIHRGSDWCTDLARVGCALCQVAGFPARLIMIYDTDMAYSGHQIIEVNRSGIWGAVDPTHGLIYRDSEGKPVSTWELRNQPNLIEAEWRSHQDLGSRLSQFRNTAIANYSVWDREDCDYTISPVNGYYWSLLQMSIRGWPGGVRWLHDEDKP